MSGPIADLLNAIKAFEIERSLIYLNHLLSVSRGEKRDAVLERSLEELGHPLPVFIVHFLAKNLLLHARERKGAILDWSSFIKLYNLYIAHNDPIVSDPTWPSSNPAGFLERLYGLQFPSQRFQALRAVGLTLGLFRDAGTPSNPSDYNLHKTLVTALGTSIEHFIGMGQLASAIENVHYNNFNHIGMYDAMSLAEAYKAGLKWCIPEIWQPFFERTACTIEQFRSVSADPLYTVQDNQFVHFEFNALCRYPIIKVRPGQFWAVDPRLVNVRTTGGLFYDLFERFGTSFTTKFGEVFEKMIGQMLLSVCSPSRIWSEAEWKQKTGRKEQRKLSAKKRGDWAYIGDEKTVLIECKSLRTNLQLMHYGFEADAEALQNKIVDALEQLMIQGVTIQSGDWRIHGIPPAEIVCLLVSYGRVFTANLKMSRTRIEAKLKAKVPKVFPFVVLSPDEFDTAIRLVELGLSFDKIINDLTGEDAVEVTDRFSGFLNQNANNERKISNYSFRKSTDLFRSLDLPSIDGDPEPEG